jgi:rod shape-determining protein MreB
MLRIRSGYSTSSSPDFALDLGTSKVALYVRGEGLVLEEPACIALYGDHTSLKSVVATGELAAQMIGKTPAEVRVLRPIQNGVITDSRITGLIVAAMLSRLKMTRNFRRKKVLIGALLGANSMELKAFSEVGLFAGARSSVMVPEPFAAAIGGPKGS